MESARFVMNIVKRILSPYRYSPPADDQGQRLEGVWRKVGVGVWALIFVLSLAAFAMSVHYLDLWFRTPYLELSQIDPQIEADQIETSIKPFQEALGDLGLSLETYSHYFTTLRILAGLPYFLLSILVIVRRSDRLIAVLTASAMCLLGAAGPVYKPLWQWIPETYFWHESLSKLLNAINFCIILILYLFPEGRIVPRWTRWLVYFIVPYAVLSNFVTGDSLFNPWNWPGQVAVLPQIVLIGGGIYALVYRYRHYADPVQKQQIKWFVTGAVLVVVNWFIDYGVWEIYPALTGKFLIQPGHPAVLWELFQDTSWYTAEFLFAICVAISVFRYHLWEIDLIVRRTIQYVLVTGVLALVYFSVVTLLQNLFTAVSGQESPAAVVLSTLAIAVMFNPLRRRVQGFIDRRFDRFKYDAQKALQGFVETTRRETDLAEISTCLADTVLETLKPERISLWLTTVSLTTGPDEGKMEAENKA